MQIPSTVFPEQEAIQFCESRQYFTMPTPDPGYQLTLEQRPDGSVTIDGKNNLTDVQTLELLRAYTQQIEARLQKKAHEPETCAETYTTTVSQPIDDCDGFPTKTQTSGDFNTKPPLSISTIFPAVEVVSTSVEENTPTELQKPCFGNYMKTDILADLMKQSGIPAAIEEEEEEQQVTLGVENDVVEQSNQVYAKPECLPCLEVFQDANIDLPPEQADFELETKDLDEFMKTDPYMNEVVETINTGTENVYENKQPEVLNLGEFTGSFALGFSEDDGKDMGAYRDYNPPSVASVVSNSTYTSEYTSALSPRQELEACEEIGVTPHKVTGRRGSRRTRTISGSKGVKRISAGKDLKRISAGKDLKRLSCGPKALISSSGKPYPAPARNGKLSRFPHTDYTESCLQEHWWIMLKRVEEMLLKNIDYQTTKVEDLRKYCHDLFAVAMYTPVDWGNNQKRKGIYKMALKERYNWDPNVPFCSLNNGPKNSNNGDAPRAKKDDLVLITPYLVKRYVEDVRPHIKARQENGELAPLPLLEEIKPPAVGQFTAPLVPKLEPIDTSEVNECDFPAPVSMPTAAFPVTMPTATCSSAAAGDEVNFSVTEFDASSTVDVNQLSEILGIMMTSNGSTDNYDSLNVERRQADQQMDVDGDMMYANPEMKPGSPKEQLMCKVKLEHSYSMPDDEEVAMQKMQGMSTYQCSDIPGTVLELAEGSVNMGTQVQATVDEDVYFAQKLAELRPDLFDSVLSVIESQQPTC